MSDARMKREEYFAKLYAEAMAAGKAAVDALTVIPMGVQDGNTGEIIEVVADGACGFAWVNVKPGTSPFAKWLVAQGYARKDSYYGGVSISIRDYGQSVQKKECHARVMAQIFSDGGHRATSRSQLD